MFICVENKSGRSELEIGKTYELFHHECGPKFVWVKIPDPTNKTVGYRTIQCYRSDFSNVSLIRDKKIDQLLG